MEERRRSDAEIARSRGEGKTTAVREMEGLESQETQQEVASSRLATRVEVLGHNPLAATFEFVDYQAQALAELERGAPDGPFCQQIIQLWRRARIGNAAPLKDKEAVLDAFDAEDVD